MSQCMITVWHAPGGHTQGPLAAADQHLGGFWIVEAAHDDAARALAARASHACGQRVELRRLQG
ncbi:hypothetical protein [Micrococcus sp.]|uniref:hypothetical protein n=1 Tax=Micrococcus sp. TaxID=1271 RepID=UPI002A90BBC4|nr:hypothetical protein [Micrococcus sp.]MDY6055047.1 hypothetical protein [Micrococcus sp.]